MAFFSNCRAGPVSEAENRISGGAFFNNSYDSSFDTLTGGWSYTNVNYTDPALYPNYPNDPDFDYQYGAYPGTAPGGSGNYAVAFVGDPSFGGVVPTIAMTRKTRPLVTPPKGIVGIVALCAAEAQLGCTT